MTKPIFILTEAAQKRVVELMEASASAKGLRVSVKTRGCNGKMYDLSYVDSPQKGDEVLDAGRVKVYIDPMAMMYVIGTTLDYFDTGIESGFIFQNPNEKGRCGCGESFHV